MAENVGKAEIVVSADTKKAEIDLERFRKRLEATGRSYDKLLKEDLSRSFSENFRKGFEQGVIRSIQKGETRLYQFSHGVGVAASSLHKMKSSAEYAAESFQKLQRVGLFTQASLGTLAGTIGDLVGSVEALVGVIGAAAPAAVALGSTFVALGVGMVGVKIAMAGVSNAIGTVWQSQTALNDTFRAARQEYIGLKFAAEGAALSQEDAALKLEAAREALARVQDLPPDNRLRRTTQLAYEQADLQLREAKHKSEEAYRAVKKGITATNAYQPLAPLSAVQLEFVKFVISIRPQMRALKDEVAKGFIPKLQSGIQTIVKYALPSFKTGLTQVASAMGNAFKSFANAFKDQGNLINLRSMFKSSAEVIEKFGSAIASTFGSFLSILHAAEPLTKRFAEYMDRATKAFAFKMRVSDFNGDLGRTFKLAGDVSAGIGKVFKNVWDGVKNIVKAAFPSGVNSGAGGVMLTWLQSITEGFKTLTASKGFSDWLKRATEGGVAALSTIGQFLKIFVDLAGNKGTKEFWETLRLAIPYVTKILDIGQLAGKQLAQFLVEFTRILASVSDAGTLVSFMNAMVNIFKVFADVLSSPPIQFLLSLFGQIHGPILAIIVAVGLLKKAFEIFLGYVIKITNGLAGMQSRVKSGLAGWSMFRTNLADARNKSEGLWHSIMQLGRVARDTRMLQMARDAGVAKDRLAQLELQMLSNNRAAVLYNETTRESVTMMEMSEDEALQMIERYRQIASQAGFTAVEVEKMSNQMLDNVVRREGGKISNQGLLAGTGMEGGAYKPRQAGNPFGGNRGQRNEGGTVGFFGRQRRQKLDIDMPDLSAPPRVPIKLPGRSWAGELREMLAANLTKLKYEGVYQIGRARRGLQGLRDFLSRSKAEVAEVFAATATKLKYEGVYQVGRARRALANFREEMRQRLELFKSQSIFDVKRRASYMEQLKYMMINAKYATQNIGQTIKQSRAYDTVTSALGRTKSFIADIIGLNRIRAAGELLNGKPHIWNQKDKRGFRMAQYNMPSSSESTPKPIPGAVPGPPGAGLVKTLAQQKAIESGYTSWWASQLTLRARLKRALDLRGFSEENATMAKRLGNVIQSLRLEMGVAIGIAKAKRAAAQGVENEYTAWWQSQLTLRARIKRALDIRGLADENASLGVRLVNVARTLVLEGAIVSQAKRQQLMQTLATIRRETAETIAAAATRAKYDVIYQLGRAKRAVSTFKNKTLPTMRAEVAEFIASTATKIKYDAIYNIGRAKRALVNFKDNVKLYAADSREFMKAVAAKSAFQIRQLRANMRWQWAAFKQDNPMIRLWDGIKNSSLNAAKQARYAWAASNGATEAELNELIIKLREIKTMQELNASGIAKGAGAAGGGGFKGMWARSGSKIGMVGMGASMLGSTLSMGGENGPTTGGVMQALGGVAMMFGPAGMVAGSLLGIGGMIVDSIDKAEKERKLNTKMVQIIADNALVTNLNKVKTFEGDALTGALSANGTALTKSRSEAANVSQLIESRAGTNFKGSAGQIGSAGDLTEAGRSFALTNRRSFKLSADSEFTDLIQGTIQKVAGGTGSRLTPEQLGTTLGKITGITKGNAASRIDTLKDAGIIGKTQAEAYLKSIKFNDKGAITTDSLRNLYEKIGEFADPNAAEDNGGTSKFIPNLGLVPGLKEYGLTTSNLEFGNQGIQNRDFVYGKRNINTNSVNSNIVLEAFSAFGLGKKPGKSVTEDAQGNISYNTQRDANKGLMSIAGLSKILTGKEGLITDRTVTMYKGLGGAVATPDQYAKFDSTKKKSYNKVETAGYQVGDQFMTFDQVKTVLSKFNVGEDGKKFNVGQELTPTGFARLVKASGITDIQQNGEAKAKPLIDSIVGADAAVQSSRFANASMDIKTAAANFGTAAAKLDGYGQLIADNTKKAIAYAIVASSPAGKAAIAAHDTNQVERLIRDEMRILGLNTK